MQRARTGRSNFMYLCAVLMLSKQLFIPRPPTHTYKGRKMIFKSLHPSIFNVSAIYIYDLRIQNDIVV